MTELPIERLAEAIHERYRSSQAGRKPADDPALRPWSALDETLRESNRSQAADIGPKLRSIGCYPVPLREAEPFTFTAAEIERLSEREHLRWVADRRASGWTAGPVRDPARRVTPDLVPYDELPEAVRELDREAVRAIPALLAGAGLGIRRAVSSPHP